MTSKFEPFLVAPQKTGTDLSLDPWLLPQDAYQQVLDAYQYLGDVYKRDGCEWFDSVPHAIDGGAGHHYQNISNITNGPNSIVTTTAAHGLSSGQWVRLTGVVGLTGGPAPINGTRWTITVTAPTTFTLNNGSAFVGAYTINTGTVSFFPSQPPITPMSPITYLPITAIATYTDRFNAKTLLVLDTRRASFYDPTIGALTPIGYQNQFTGTAANLFWWENYIPPNSNTAAIYFTNNVDNIFYWDGTQQATGLTAFTPRYDNAGGGTVTACLMIKAAGRRLTLLNTTEAGVSYPIRIRWCGPEVDPLLNAATMNPTPWEDVIPGFGGDFADLLDSQYIITLGQIQGNIIVASQVNTLNQGYAAIFQMSQAADPTVGYTFNKIAQSRNVLSTFGTISIDREITFVGDNGLIVTDGNTVARYDHKIPDFAFNNLNQDTFYSCFGTRYDPLQQTCLLYTENGQTTNNRILIYNYVDRAWAIHRFPNTNFSTLDPTLGFTCLGNWFLTASDPTFGNYGSSLPDLSFEDFGEETFASLYQKGSLALLSGDYRGNVWLMNQGGSDYASNDVFGQANTPGTAIEMNLITRQWYPYAKEAVAAQFGYVDFLIDSDYLTVATVGFFIENEGAPYLVTPFTCIPFENIIVASIQNIVSSGVISIVTSENNGLETGQFIWLYGVQGMTDINGLSGTVTVIDPNTFSININSSAFSTYTGGGYITSEAITQSTFWTRVWTGQTGVFHQMQIIASGVDEPFGLHAMTCYFKRSGRIYKGSR